VRRVQIHLDEDLDRAAAAEAARRGLSKAGLIRQALAHELGASETSAAARSAWDDMIGWLDDDPVADIDEVLYGSAS
jgi:hypothetical protein